MSIIRTKSPHRFTIVSNELLAESNPMSWEATGLLIYLLSKPDNWQVSIAALTNIGKCGKNKIESILKELKRLGYIVGRRRSSGKYDYYVYDTPQSPPTLPKPENQVEAQKFKKPKPENPVQAFPVQDFQSLINTDIEINTENNNNNNSETINSNHHAVNAHELLLSLNFEETAPTPSKALSSEPKERQKEEVVLFPLSGLNERQAKEASKKLAQLSSDQREIAIMMFNQTAELGRIRKPMALVNQLVNLGLNNELEPPVNAFNQNPSLTPAQELKTPVAANLEDSRKETEMEVLKLRIAKYKNKMLAEYKQKRAVFIQGLGVFYQDDLAAAGLFD